VAVSSNQCMNVDIDYPRLPPRWWIEDDQQWRRTGRLDDRCEHFQHSLLNNQPTRRRRMTAALRLLPPPDSSARAPPTFSINKSCNSIITFPIVVTPESHIIVGVLFNNHRGANTTHRRGDFWGTRTRGARSEKKEEVALVVARRGTTTHLIHHHCCSSRRITWSIVRALIETTDAALHVSEK
jgi:hypothetical protein